MELVLQQKQTLNLVMTTELRQAIELLQYSTYDLVQFIREQEQENPFIELVDKGYDAPFRERRSNQWRSPDSEVDPLDFVACDDFGMQDDLVDQLKLLELDEEMSDIVQYLILNLDESGYLSLSDEEICSHLQLEPVVVEHAVHTLQGLEPVGIGARNLTECLLLQAEHMYPEDLTLQSIIVDHLEDLANRKWEEIAKQLDIKLVDVKEAYECIQTFDPKPATTISSPHIEYLNPDIIVEIDEDTGDFQVYLNDNYVPEVRFNRDYSNEIASAEQQVSQYVNNHFRRYQWLQNSIQQRRNTILKIMKVLLIEQQDFFTDGLKALKPLTLKEVADLIEMHESTVSRATANKVVQTPQGSFELRKLFSTSLSTASGENASQTTVKMMLKDIVDNEDKYKPLSDQKIADLLKEDQGVKISRRTVAKYRSELNIPSSTRRKEIKV